MTKYDVIFGMIFIYLYVKRQLKNCFIASLPKLRAPHGGALVC